MNPDRDTAMWVHAYRHAAHRLDANGETGNNDSTESYASEGNEPERHSTDRDDP